MSKLNAAQTAAVYHQDGPLLVLAGAGSGKTRVITHRIGQLIERGVRPERILAVTFTNKASLEMAERLVSLVGAANGRKTHVSTFHSFGVRFLGEENRALGYDGKFVIFDQGDCSGVLRNLIRKELGITKPMDIMALLSRISIWRNAFLRPEQIQNVSSEYDLLAKELFPLYERTLSQMHAVDFDDLVLAPVKILTKSEEIKQKWNRRFDYLLIDEFQDTNKSQLELVRLLVNEHTNLCVVGDDDQSIYGWRGAEIGNILDFEKYFPGTKIVKLEENYRSREPILHVANHVISSSQLRRHPKKLVATRMDGEKVRLCKLDDPSAEARFVAIEMRAIARDGSQWRDMAVLYRSNQQARLIEEELRIAGIPYRMFGGTQFYDRKEIKDAIAYLRVVVHPQDEISLRRIINYPTRGLGDTSLDRIAGYAARHSLRLFDALTQADSIEGLSEPSKRGARNFVASIRHAREAFRTGKPIVETTKKLLSDVGMMGSLSEVEGNEGTRRRDNMDFLIKSIERFESNAQESNLSIGSFLARLTMRFEGEEEETGNRVTLSSLHSAKGLEFDHVFLIGCVEGILPHSRTTDPKITEAVVTDIDEERRLFYVGITRAKERLYLSYSVRRMIRGRSVPFIPSRFLDHVPDEWIEKHDNPERRILDHDETAANAAAILALLGQSRS